MTAEQAAEVLALLASIRAILEVGAFAAMVGAAFIVGGVLHRWSSGR